MGPARCLIPPPSPPTHTCLSSAPFPCLRAPTLRRRWRRPLLLQHHAQPPRGCACWRLLRCIPPGRVSPATTSLPLLSCSARTPPLRPSCPLSSMKRHCCTACRPSALLPPPMTVCLAALLYCCRLYRRRMLANGNHQLGYDLGTITSVGLLATAVPAARATGDSYSVAMTALGGAWAARCAACAHHAPCYGSMGAQMSPCVPAPTPAPTPAWQHVCVCVCLCVHARVCACKCMHVCTCVLLTVTHCIAYAVCVLGCCGGAARERGGGVAKDRASKGQRSERGYPPHPQPPLAARPQASPSWPTCSRATSSGRASRLRCTRTSTPAATTSVRLAWTFRAGGGLQERWRAAGRRTWAAELVPVGAAGVNRLMLVVGRPAH